MPSNYPTALDTTTSLSIAVNGLQTTLNGDHTSGATTITVQSTSGAPAAGYCYLDSEVVRYTGTTPTTLTGCTRGADSTAPAQHTNGTIVKFGTIADHHNALVTAIIGAQTKLGTNTNGASATSIDAAQLAAGSSASLTNLTASGFLRTAGYSVNVGAGALAYAQATVTQTLINAQVDLTSLTVTVTTIASRRIRVSGFIPIAGTVAGDTFLIQIMEGATVLVAAKSAAIPAGGQGPHAVPSVILLPSAAAHTYKITAARIQGTGTMTVDCAATSPAYILVEDIGI